MPFGFALRSAMRVAGSAGSFTGRNCVPGMLTVPGYVISTWMASTMAELKVLGPGTSVVITSTFPSGGQVESPPNVVVVVVDVEFVEDETIVVVVEVVTLVGLVEAEVGA